MASAAAVTVDVFNSVDRCSSRSEASTGAGRRSHDPWRSEYISNAVVSLRVGVGSRASTSTPAAAGRDRRPRTARRRRESVARRAGGGAGEGVPASLRGAPPASASTAVRSPGGRAGRSAQRHGMHA